MNLHNYVSETKWYGGTSMDLQVRKTGFSIYEVPTWGFQGLNSLSFKTSKVSFFLFPFVAATTLASDKELERYRVLLLCLGQLGKLWDGLGPPHP